MQIDLCYQTQELRDIKSVKRQGCESIQKAVDKFKEINRPEIIISWLEYFEDNHHYFLKYLKGGK